MSATTVDAATPFLEAVTLIAPLIAEHRATFDRERRIPDIVFNALADAGLFRLWLPRTLGGPELSPIDFMRVVEAAAALDGSVGWLVGNGGGMSRVGGYLGAPVAREIFSCPRSFIVSSTGAVGSAIPVHGGYRVTGRWPFGSGAPHATHFMVLATLGGDQAPSQPRLCCYADRSQVAIHDTWHVSGMRGTSSSDFELQDVFVATDRVHPFIGHEPTDGGIVYRMPGISVFGWTVAVVPLGIARGAIDAFIRHAKGKARLGSSGQMRDSEIVQNMVGRVETMHAAGRTLLTGSMLELMAATDAGGERLINARARLRSAAAHAAETALAIVDRLASEAGTAAIFETGPLERAIRDVQAAAKHIAMNPATFTIAGRLSLGLEPGTARF